ncbi:hypothetical protein NC99_11100 [Sunxiuqinia dokdonensis]|uniref:Uncharacterized protein n=1 Tax=Sunxiuqinia dokdonensis TaxID=1409788 RepID=A0A0L8VC80_9BACT|nr:hypothetical protein NC99_11100 [Sunxiuqinia dokdonensis]
MNLCRRIIQRGIHPPHVIGYVKHDIGLLFLLPPATQIRG